MQKTFDNNDNRQTSKLIKELINTKFTNPIIQGLTRDEDQESYLEKNLLREMVSTYFKNSLNHPI